MYQGVIYCAVSPSGKKYYGFTYNLYRRKYIHKRDSIVKKNRFYNAIKKYGFDNFIWNVIETYTDEDREYIKDVLRKRERFWIINDKTFLPEFGYNMTLGGDGGDTFSNKSDEDKKITRQKHIESNRKRKIPLYSKTFYEWWVEKHGKEIADEKLKEFKKKKSESGKGKSHPCSEETKEKIRKKLLGTKISEENRRKRFGKKNASGKRSEEIKEKMRKPKSKEHIENLRRSKKGQNRGEKNPMYNKFHSEDTKKQMRISQKMRREKELNKIL